MQEKNNKEEQKLKEELKEELKKELKKEIKEASKEKSKEKKYKIDMERLIHIMINLVIYFAVFFINDENTAILIILAIIPILLAINSFTYGFRTRGCDPIYSMLSALVFVPFVYIKLNETYMIYVLMFLGFLVISNVVGSFLSRFRKRPDGCADGSCNCKWTL